MALIESDLALIHRLADEANALALSYFQREFGRWSKADGSLATDADIAIERAIRQRLAVQRPADAFLGEEEGQTGEGPRRWIVDAIDGTSSFAAGEPDWGTLIALESDGRVVVGLCEQPLHARRYWAAKGHGAMWSDSSGVRNPLTVSTGNDLASARSYVPGSKRRKTDRARRIAESLLVATDPRPFTNHPALHVAAGDLEVAVFLGDYGPWDLAAFTVIVEEAGGRFSDMTGAWDLFKTEAVFSNGRVHDAVLSACQNVAPGLR